MCFWNSCSNTSLVLIIWLLKVNVLLKVVSFFCKVTYYKQFTVDFCI